jgi:hypothetical protein
MKYYNYTSEYLYYAIENDTTILSFGILDFCSQLETNNNVKIFNLEGDLEKYLNEHHEETDWYSNNKPNIQPQPYSLEFIDNAINMGCESSLGFRLNMSDVKSSELNSTLLSAKEASLTPDSMINVLDVGNNIHSITLSQFNKLVFDYNQTRVSFMKVVNDIKTKLNSVENPDAN